jgi:hypothetical protein
MKGGTMKRKIHSGRCIDYPQISGATGATGAKGITGSNLGQGKETGEAGATGPTGSGIQSLDHLQ